MILLFNDWVLSKPQGGLLGYQYDNLTRELVVQGDLPEGWTWDMLVSASGNSDTWPLALGDGQASITLTDDNLSVRGEYYLQLRGTNGDRTRHTNVITAYNSRSLSGAGKWPTLPTEWIQAEKDIKELNAHPPVPGSNGYWLLWDLSSHSYQESDLPVPVGPAGPPNVLEIGTVETLPADQPATASITGESPAQKLNLGIPQGKQGATGNPGAPGKDGQTPTIAVGTVTTLDPGQDATAEITGETPNLTLNLGIPQGPPGQDGVQLNDDAINTTEAWSSKKIVDTLCPAFTVEGNPVTCQPVEGYPLGVKVSFSPRQEGEGDPSPENVRPISGYDSLSVTRCGKNLFGGESVEGIINAGNKQLMVGPIAEYPTFITRIKPGETYTASRKTTGIIRLGVSPEKPHLGMAFSKSLSTTGNNLRIIAGENDKWIACNVPYYQNDQVQLELGSSPTSYEPYQSDTYDITLPETVYGGSVDVVTGVGSKTWGYIASYNGESLPGEWISDRDVYASGTTPTTGAQVAYKLATPEPFQATGNQALPAVAGLNTLYTDGDSLEVSGRRDLLHTLQTMQAQTQNLNRFIAEGGTQ